MEPDRDFTVANVPIWEQLNVTEEREEYFIHEIRVKPAREGLPKMLMLHGYAGGSAYFYRLIKPLRDYFEIVAIDLLGQACSGRPTYTQRDDFDSTVAYFLDSIQAWIDKTGWCKDGEKFTMAGHSMGGMYAGHYALRHPDKVERLVFLSTVGINKPEEFAQSQTFMSEMDSCLGHYGGHWCIDQMSGGTFTPLDFYRIMGERLSLNGIERGMKRRLDVDVFSGPEELQHLCDYIYQMIVRRKSSEVVISRIFVPFAYVHKPLEDQLEKLKIPMAFIFGEFDWVSRAGSDRLVDSGKVQGEVLQVSNTSHQLQLEAPDETTACIIKFSHGEAEARAFLERLEASTQNSVDV